MKKCRFLLMALAILICCSSLSSTAYAAETTDAKISRLEKKYGIVIKMDESVYKDEGCSDFTVVKSNVGNIPYEWVAALEDELRYIPSALNDYVRKNVKQPLTIRFISLPATDGYIVIERTGQYTSGNNTITLMFGTGGLVHEYAHMLDYFFLQKNTEFLKKWKACNESTAYGNNYDSMTEQQKKAFTGWYATTSIHEDIAETFDMLSRSTWAHSARKNGGGLSKKLDLMEAFIENLVGQKGLYPDSHPQMPSTWAAESSERFMSLFYRHDYGLYQNDITRRVFCSYALTMSEKAAQGVFGKALIKRDDFWYNDSTEFSILNTATGEYGSKMVMPTYFDDTYDYDIRMAYLLRIVSGNGNGTFNPEGKITRQEAAVLLANLCRLFGVNTDGFPTAEFSDMNNAASWATDSISFVNSAGIMAGTGSNMFSPTSYYTYEQTYISLLRTYDYIAQNVQAAVVQ